MLKKDLDTLIFQIQILIFSKILVFTFVKWGIKVVTHRGVMKKLKSLILTIFLFMTSLCFSNTLFKPGTYVGSAQGYGGPIKVEVKTTDSKILSLDILEQKELVILL